MKLSLFLCLGAWLVLGGSTTAVAQEPGTDAPAEPPTPSDVAAPPAADAPPSDAPIATDAPADLPPAQAPPPEATPAPPTASEPPAPDADETATSIDAPGPPAARPRVDRMEGGLESEELETEEAEEPEVPWRGSVVEYRNAVGIRNLDPYADLTHDPYYIMALSLRPRWWFGDVLNVSARFDITHELTDPDETTYANESVISDLYLSVGAKQLVTIPEIDVHVSPELRLTLPTSKLSQYRTLVLGVGPGVAITRDFEIGDSGQLTVGYRPRLTFNFHSSTTAQRDTPLVQSCLSCEQYFNSGVRNAPIRLWNGFDVTYTLWERLSVGVSYAHITDWLYSMDESPPDGVIDGGAEAVTQEDPATVRFSSAFSFEVSVIPFDLLEIGVGWETLSPQLSDGSTYYNPIYNRYSQAYVDLRLQVDALVEQIEDL